MRVWVYVSVGTSTYSARITRVDMDIDVRWIESYHTAYASTTSVFH